MMRTPTECHSGRLPYNPARFDFITLHLVVACAETGTLTSAARRFNLVPGAASRRIRDLERTLGCQLFSRNSRGMSPTPAGKTLLPHALALVQQMDCMVDALNVNGNLAQQPTVRNH